MKNEFGFSTSLVLVFATLTSLMSITILRQGTISLNSKKYQMSEIRVRDFIEFSNIFLRDQDNCSKEIELDNNGDVSFAPDGAIKRALTEYKLDLYSLTRTSSSIPGGTINELKLTLRVGKKRFKKSLHLFLVNSGGSLIGCKSTLIDTTTEMTIEERICSMTQTDKKSFNPATGLCTI